MKTGDWASVMVARLIVKFCVALGLTPLLAVSVIVMGVPFVFGGVPLITPVVGLKLAQVGKPLALNVGEGIPSAVTVKLPASPTVNVVLVALVKTGGTVARVSLNATPPNVFWGPVPPVGVVP